ncbi:MULTISPECIES: diguanylate cyclase [Stutzerimonas stutzeri group]|jgi:diguanylate cyclase (GGDEF)-like protein|uniref:GGDEF domain-containing protein n=1 Tax=Stutzerimonas stutzeri subgroup TaxID=578833 RepID=UPI0005B31427|nr:MULTISPECIES: GGDEF domain-containing protein [Stutzerimonas stutzeri group]HBW09994.1 GGDEF domain-containing protein [Pseudomonas sp.]KJS72661.1 MAG: diguanylate cyclase [[Pseudomonas] sp. BICA1-14]MCQ2047671.1 GGDEF domain-containing protein [Stutzerimonas kunmingensis]PKR27903.1 GGDEF domain-containing protein [Stutzerimonas stutzeri]QQC10664.1 GGDEF domain-containing protein [Stutzerimonas stutzeri]
MPSILDLLRSRLSSLLPSELKPSELRHLLSPRRHPLLLCQRRATLIVNRVRLFAFLFAVLTPLWSLIDLMVFEPRLWAALAGFRMMACLAFTCLLLFYRPSGNLLDAYRAIAILFAIPTIFYIASHTLLGSYQLAQFSAVVGAGYAFLPFVLMAGLTIFPLTLVENLVLSSLLLLAQALAGYLSWATLNWPSFAGAFWLLILIAGVASLASMSQLAFMFALVRQAIRDPLTGVFSRGSGEEILRLQWDSAQRKDGPLALAFIDLDHFKSINDNHGHESGDQVLREAARRLVATLRGSDSLLRWGGEEFLLIMPETDMQQAHMALERIIGQGLGVRPDGAPLTASIGLAERRCDQVADYRDLLELADKRMYCAKTSGRNRLCAMEPEAVQPPQAFAVGG